MRYCFEYLFSGKTTQPMQRKLYKLTFFFFLFFFSIAANAQSGFNVGAFVAPILTHPEFTFYTNNPNNLSLTYGLNVDYAFNKSWSVSMRPSYSKLNYFSNCVDTIKNKFVGSLAYVPEYIYTVSNSNCLFTRESSESFFDIPIIIRYTFNSHKWDKLRKYILIGNSINIKLQYKNLITDNRTKEDVTQMALSHTEGDPIYLFYPTIGSGIEYLFSEKNSVYSDLSIRTHSDYYFKNFTMGLTVGIKARL